MILDEILSLYLGFGHYYYYNWVVDSPNGQFIASFLGLDIRLLNGNFSIHP